MTKDKKTLIATDVEEHGDGSSTYSFDVDEETYKWLAELGLRFILTCAANKLDIEDALEKLCKLSDDNVE